MEFNFLKTERLNKIVPFFLHRSKACIPAILTTLSILLTPCISPAAENGRHTIAILPFKMNVSQPMEYIQQGVSRMFASRLWGPDTQILSGNRLEIGIPEKGKDTRDSFIYQVATRTGSNYVLSGSITELSGAFSVDAKIFDIQKKRYMPFSETSEKIDHLIQKTDEIAARINKKIFDRTTATWEKLEKEKKERFNQLQRQNPERLLQNRQWQKSEESIGWKIWKQLF